jgi:TolA-binding protein
VTVADLHPEDLLEREAGGKLGEAERARLQAHLTRCATCRFERLLRADFVAELEADEAPDALAGLSARPSRVAVPARPRRVRRVLWSRARVAWLVAAATLLVGGVAAATGMTRHIWSQPVELTKEDPAPVSEVKKPKNGRAAPRVEAPHEVPSQAQEQPAPVAVNPPPAQTAAPLPPSATPAPIAAHAASHLSEMVPAPADLLDAESGARRQGDYERVVSLHRQLVSRFPGSREAQVSRAIVGRLLLDRGNPADALSSFDGYLGSGSGALEEEAMVGRATALERLGRRDEASRAWGDLLASFPESPYAAHARTRLGGGPSGN